MMAAKVGGGKSRDFAYMYQSELKETAKVKFRGSKATSLERVIKTK